MWCDGSLLHKRFSLKYFKVYKLWCLFCVPSFLKTSSGDCQQAWNCKGFQKGRRSTRHPDQFDYFSCLFNSPRMQCWCSVQLHSRLLKVDFPCQSFFTWVDPLEWPCSHCTWNWNDVATHLIAAWGRDLFHPFIQEGNGGFQEAITIFPGPEREERNFFWLKKTQEVCLGQKLGRYSWIPL